MYLNEEQIKEIEEMAELFFSLDEIATNAEIDAEDFRDAVQSKTGEAYSAYMRGWFKGEIPLRKSIAQAAANGSNPAQQMLLTMIQNAEIDKL